MIVQHMDTVMPSLSSVSVNLSGCQTMQKLHGMVKAIVVSYISNIKICSLCANRIRHLPKLFEILKYACFFEVCYGIYESLSEVSMDI